MTGPLGAQRARNLIDRRPGPEADRAWYRMTVNAAAKTADVWLYDEIGYWGITASEFCTAVAALDVSVINLRINSPGGEVFDGVAIHNALRTHKATVNVSVDGLAASIASVIAMAGNRITMQAGTQMMIHDASGMCLGNAADMRQCGDLLDKLSDTIAGFYAARAGGSLTSWRDTMKAETWYSPSEAMAAGLIDEAADAPAPTDSAVPRHEWDLRGMLGYRYGNRSEAPAPAPIDRTAPLVEPGQPEHVELSPIDLDVLRDMLTPPALIPISLDDLTAAVALGTTTVPSPDTMTSPPPAAPSVDALAPMDLDALRSAVRGASQA